MNFSAQIRGVEGLEPALQAAVHEGTEAGLEVLGAKGTEMVVENIKTPYGSLPPAVAFGHLAGSIAAKFERDASMATEIIGVSPNVGADVYAPPVETGARPHMPPASALLPWIQKKFGITDEKQALSMAFAVAKTIAKRGTQGHEMFSRALEALEPLTPEILEKYIAIAMTAHGFTGAEA